jgi:hypothetical protein
MRQLLPQSDIIIPHSYSPLETIEYINSYIENYHCEYISIDLSFMNVIDTCYVTTLCSTKHFIKYPNGKIKWIISSELVRDFNHNLELGNSEYIN